MIRQATEADYPAMARLIEDCFSHQYIAELDLDKDYSAKLAEKLAKDHVMLELEIDNEIVGGVGGFITPFQFNGGTKLFQEVFFYLKDSFKKYSQLLLAELERKCKEIQLSKIIMAHPNDGNLEKMERFYKARGFKKLETHFIKRII